MYPAAGVIIWIATGALVGWFGGKITRTDDAFGVGANTGVGIVGAASAGFITTVLSKGERSTGGAWLAILMALVGACVAVALFRWMFPTRSPRFQR